jgi:ppGpp synthetase/RelA/SpoT-type nucleotidyltranferase
MANETEPSSAYLKQYQVCRPLYDAYARNVAALLESLLEDANIRVHSVTYRAKEESSLLRKLEYSQDKYSDLADVTDLAGVRVITYFEDEVNRVAELVSSEFDIDARHSIDKRKALEPDHFGYLSLHYVVSYSKQRKKLPENRRFDGLLAELQIRSVLQHTWAEIEHDLGYKTARAIPPEFRRRFSRLAGLLEIADSEFAAIRDALLNYELWARQTLPAHPEKIGIDQVSLGVFFQDNKIMQAMHAFIIEHGGRVSEKPLAAFIDSIAQALLYLGASTMDRVQAYVVKYGAIEMEYMRLNYGGSSFDDKMFHIGTPLFFICEIVALEKGGIDELDRLKRQTNATLIAPISDLAANYAKAKSLAESK